MDAAYHVHTSLGPGLLESVYEMVLAYELEKRALRVVRQQPVPIVYQGTRIEMGFRADLIVEDLVIVEIKSVEVVAPVHKKQLLTHLRLADKRLGLLINFNVALIRVLSRISCKRFSALFKVFGLPPSVIAGAKQEHGSVWLGLLPPFLVRERMPDLVSGHLIGLYVGW